MLDWGVARPSVGAVGPSSQRQNAIRSPGKSFSVTTFAYLEICKLSSGHPSKAFSNDDSMQHSAHESCK